MKVCNSGWQYMLSAHLRPIMDNVDSSPINPKQWSPCTCEMKIWLRRDRCVCCFLMLIWVPSPQSISSSFSWASKIWADWLAVGVGMADPLPNMVNLNVSISLFLLFLIVKIRISGLSRNPYVTYSLFPWNFVFAKNADRVLLYSVRWKWVAFHNFFVFLIWILKKIL